MVEVYEIRYETTNKCENKMQKALEMKWISRFGCTCVCVCMTKLTRMLYFAKLIRKKYILQLQICNKISY